MNLFQWWVLVVALAGCSKMGDSAGEPPPLSPTAAGARGPAAGAPMGEATGEEGRHLERKAPPAPPPADAPAPVEVAAAPDPATVVVDGKPADRGPVNPGRDRLELAKPGYRGEKLQDLREKNRAALRQEEGERLGGDEDQPEDLTKGFADGERRKVPATRDGTVVAKPEVVDELVVDDAEEKKSEAKEKPREFKYLAGQNQPSDEVGADRPDTGKDDKSVDRAQGGEGQMGKMGKQDLRKEGGRYGIRSEVHLDTGLLDDGWFANTAEPEKPMAFLPRFFYFENTYQGRSAHFIERLRRLDAAWSGGERPYALATLPPQPVDPPDDKGLSLSVALDRQWIDQPGKVYLQVTLQGSSRFGWRRPPLDMAVVVDVGAVARRPEAVVAALQRLLGTLGPQDRLGVIVAGDPPVVLADIGDLRETRRALGRLDGGRVSTSNLTAGMEVAGRLLQIASQGQARVPGSQTVLVIADGGSGADDAAYAAHALTVQGATTSVIELGGDWNWWPVANAGHGNLHRVADGEVAAAVDAELARISQVIARLLRVNIRLAPNVQAIRVLGSRVLEEEEVRQVKAREEATDRQLSATLGVKADRGDDDDGIQTVIPFFYGGDAHVIAVELWVDKPGPIAEISLKYKDMVALENATARAGARLGGVPRPTTGTELAVRRNVRGFLLAEALDEAGRMVARGQQPEAINLLARTEAGAGSDGDLLVAFRQALQRGDVAPELLSEALEFAGQRRISHVALR